MSHAEWYKKWKREHPEQSAETQALIDDFLRDTYEADFNETDHDDHVAVLVPEDGEIPELSADVHLYDADGNYCRGSVRKIAGQVIYVECHWETWWPGKAVPRDECPDRAKHRYPQGPNEDMGLCRLCRWPAWELRPDGETYGDHLPDCSLPRRHESYCQPGGAGHPRAAKIRGYFGPRIDEDTDLVAVTAEGSVEIKGYWT